MDLYNVIKTRRSTRKFTAQAIEKEKIDAIMNAALMSPSSKNSQPWHFVLVEDKAMLARLSESREQGSQFIAGAALAIVVVVDETGGTVWVEDASIASAYIQLQAENLGLGSCWVQVRDRMRNEIQSAEDYVRVLLGIPQGYRILNIIALGYKDGEKKPHDETTLKQEKIHYAKWHNLPNRSVTTAYHHLMPIKIKKNSRMAWGVTLVLFGILYLCAVLQVGLPSYIYEPRSYPLYAGIIFLIFNKYKSPGIVMIIVGLLLRFSYELHFLRNFWDYVWPPLMIIVGALLIWKVYRNENALKRKK